MKLEDNSDDGANHHEKSNQKRPLYRHVVEILKTLNGLTTPADPPVLRLSTPGDASFTYPMSVADGFPGLDVMPTLSNGLSPNMWGFLDFQLPEDIGKEKLPMTGDVDGDMGVTRARD